MPITPSIFHSKTRPVQVYEITEHGTLSPTPTLSHFGAGVHGKAPTLLFSNESMARAFLREYGADYIDYVIGPAL